MAKGPSPLLGYNTNVRHKGRVYHIQTEDSGLAHPHIITHLFADGGRIVASRKTSYAQHVGDEGYAAIVKRLMQEQHKALFIALRDGVFDRDLDPSAPSVPPPAPTASGDTRAPAPEALPPVPPRAPAFDVDALERAAAAIGAEAPAAREVAAVEPSATLPGAASPLAAEPALPAGRYQSTRPAVRAERVGPGPEYPEGAPAFGGELLTERSLDEVILSYLAEDLDQDL
jgi:hypothetical protein